MNKKIIVIDIKSKEVLSNIDFIPSKSDRMALMIHSKLTETIVESVLHVPSMNQILIFVNIVPVLYTLTLLQMKDGGKDD